RAPCPGLKPRTDNKSRLKPALECGGQSRRFGMARHEPRAGDCFVPGCMGVRGRHVPGAKAAGLTLGKPTEGATMATHGRIRSGNQLGADSPAPSVGFAS